MGAHTFARRTSSAFYLSQRYINITLKYITVSLDRALPRCSFISEKQFVYFKSFSLSLDLFLLFECIDRFLSLSLVIELLRVTFRLMFYFANFQVTFRIY